MKVKTMSEREAKEASAPPVLPEGDYDCEVKTAVEKKSKSSGAAMFEIDLTVFTPEGKTRTVRDWVMVEGNAAWRLRQFCKCFGMMEDYEAGEVEAFSMERRTGRVKLKREEGDEQYGPKNRVKAYLEAQAGSEPRRNPAPRQMAMAGGSTGADLDDDDIPFGPEWR